MLKNCFIECNYIQQVLSKSGEGEFLIKLYQFEKNKDNYAKLLAAKKRSYFSIHAVARIVIFDEVQRTGSYTYVNILFI